MADKKPKEQVIELTGIHHPVAGAFTKTKKQIEQSNLTFDGMVRAFVKDGMDDIAGLIDQRVPYVVKDNENGQKTAVWKFCIVPDEEAAAIRSLLRNTFDQPHKRAGTKLELISDLVEQFKDKPDTTFGEIHDKFLIPLVQQLKKIIEDAVPSDIREVDAKRLNGGSKNGGKQS